ncbi:spondin domain-containing protein [Lacinutrix chionoecetis]
MKKLIFGLALLCLITVSCSNDDDGTIINQPESVNLKVTIENVLTPSTYFSGGLAATPIGETTPGPIFPGGAYEFSFDAGPNVLPGDGGTRVNFLTMFVQSNDLFLSPDGEGIALFDAMGNPNSGDVTNQVKLWDAGTEVNEVTGSANQKPQQAADASDQGVDENGVVTEITGNTDGVNVLPDVDEVAQVTLTHNGGTNFTLRIENISTMTTIATPAQGSGTTAAVPMSPAVYTIHTSPNPFFETGEAASEGVEDIAEDGFAMVENMRVLDNSGLIIPISPGVWAVHDQGINPLFTSGQPDNGEGLEGIAEDGTPSNLAVVLSTKMGVSSSALFNTPVGTSTPGAVGPGDSYSFDITAKQGDYLSFATMSIQSNDWIYTFSQGGISLFNGANPVTGDVTSNVKLYDVGTEVDEFPGAGLNQVIRQSALNTGPVDPNTQVREVNPFPANVPLVQNVVRVTISQL